MIKGKFWLISLLILGLLLSSCFHNSLSASPTDTETLYSLPTSIQQISTATLLYPIDTATLTPFLSPSPFPTQTITPIPLPTLEPEQAMDAIKTMLKKPGDCPTPCFWGIIPGQTPLSKANIILSHLGLHLEGPKSDNNDLLYGSSIKIDSGLYVFIGLTVVNERVMDLRIKIDPEKQKGGVEREWLIFSPETMIELYDKPSRVDLFWGRGPITQFSMAIYFDAIDTIVEYGIPDLGRNTQICPLHDQFDSVSVWMGKNPYHPPLAGEPLEKTTDLTLETFSQLMTGNPDKACFNLKVDMFP